MTKPWISKASKGIGDEYVTKPWTFKASKNEYNSVAKQWIFKASRAVAMIQGVQSMKITKKEMETSL